MQGITELPSEEEMQAQIAKEHEFNRRSFTQVKRHALMVSALMSSDVFSVVPSPGLQYECQQRCSRRAPSCHVLTHVAEFSSIEWDGSEGFGTACSL